MQDFATTWMPGKLAEYIQDAFGHLLVTQTPLLSVQRVSP